MKYRAEVGRQKQYMEFYAIFVDMYTPKWQRCATKLKGKVIVTIKMLKINCILGYALIKNQKEIKTVWMDDIERANIMRTDVMYN